MLDKELRNLYESDAKSKTEDEHLFKPKGRYKDDRYLKISQELKRFAGPDSKLLDIGCAKGIIEKVVGGRCNYGLDIAYNNLIEAKEYLYPTSGDSQSLPYKDNSFDIVLCSEVLEHLLSPESCLNEIKRVIKNKGIVIITVPNTGSLQFRLNIAFRGEFKNHLNYPYNRKHIRFYSLRSFLELALPIFGKGSIVKIRGCAFLLMNDWSFGVNVPTPFWFRFKMGDILPRFSLGLLVVLKCNK